MMRDPLESLSNLDLVSILVLFELLGVIANMICGLLPDVTVSWIVHNLGSSGLGLVNVELVNIFIRGRLNGDLESKLRVLLRKVVELSEYRVHR